MVVSVRLKKGKGHVEHLSGRGSTLAVPVERSDILHLTGGDDGDRSVMGERIGDKAAFLISSATFVFLLR